MRSQFSLFNSHLDLVHQWLGCFIQPGMTVVDATVGNGHDLLELAKLLKGKGVLHGFDIQEEALNESKKRLEESLSKEELETLHLHHSSHEQFPEELKADCFVYNLGYLPGGDKSVTTETTSTLKSLQQACELVKCGGVISITCYPGHSEGKREMKALLEWVKDLEPKRFSVTHLSIENRKMSPEVILIQKSTE